MNHTNPCTLTPQEVTTYLHHLTPADPLKDFQQSQLGLHGGALGECLTQDARQPLLQSLQPVTVQSVTVSTAWHQ